MAIEFSKTWIWRYAAGVSLGIGIVVTACVWFLVREVSHSALRSNFELEIAEVEDAIEARLTEVDRVLVAAQALFAASESITSAEWRTFVQRLQINGKDSVVRGLGYIQRIPAGELDNFLARVRVDQPDFRMHPAGDRPVHHIIRYIEPLEQNRGAWGFDVTSNPKGAAVQERAARTGQPTLSEPLQLAQSEPGVTGLVMYGPIFDLSMPTSTVAERRAALEGWISAAIEVDTMMAGLIGDESRTVTFRIYSGSGVASERLIYERAGFDEASDQRAVRQMTHGGRTWTVEFAALPEFSSAAHSQPTVVLVLGGVATLAMSIIAFMLTSFRNRAERLAAHMTDELRASETRFRRAFEDAAVGMAVISIDGRFMRVNHAFANMVGYSVGQIQQMVGHEMTHSEDVAQDERVIDDVLTGRCDQFVIEKRYVHRTGRPVWVIHSATLIRGSDGRPDYFISQIQDITERKRMETELRHAALHDKLTGLPDRSVFEQRLKSLWRLRQESSAIFAVLFIDVDRFKQVNDLLGHEAGDALLRQVADRLRQSTRSTDLVSSRADAMPSRVGGDEFTIVVEGLESTEMAIQIALRAQQQLNEPYLLPCGKRPDVSVSVGVATSAGPYEMPEEMVHAADMAMYRAKQNGRGEWVVLADEQRGFRRTEEAEMVAVP